MRGSICLILLFVCITQSPFAYAETKSSNEESRYDKRYEAPKEAKSEVAPVIPEDQQSEEARAVTFVLTGVRVSGAVVQSREIKSGPQKGNSSDSFEAFFDQKIGKKIKLSDLSEITQTINEKFKSHPNGKHLKAVIPQQTVHNGIVFVQIVGGIPKNVFVSGHPLQAPGGQK